MGTNRTTEEPAADEKMAALITNSNAVRAVVSSVEGTIGPKGLDTMLVDKFGDVVITNDGCTILTRMEANHPAARMIISMAEAQQDEAGDGTTTATILAGALVSAGVEQVVRGVPVARVIEGLRFGVKSSLEFIRRSKKHISKLDDERLRRVALVAARQHEDIADLAVEALRLIGTERLRDPAFRLRDIIMAQEGVENEVFLGVIVDKGRMNRAMPREVKAARVLVLDDALEPEAIKGEALSTDSGFKRYVELQEKFKENVQKLVDLGVGLVAIDRSVDDIAEEMLVDAGVMVIDRVSSRELRRVAEHTGARPIKRRSLGKPLSELESYLGYAERVYEDEKLSQVRILGGTGQPMATILVGAATGEVVEERERIAQDAASAVQAAFVGGVVPGGGAIEIAAARFLQEQRQGMRGMIAYGADCVIEALKRPLAQIVANAGYNALEKVEEVISAQAASGRDSIAVDCDTGDVVDLGELGIYDPAPIKLHALEMAGEVAEAILRIDKIIRKREDARQE